MPSLRTGNILNPDPQLGNFGQPIGEKKGGENRIGAPNSKSHCSMAGGAPHEALQEPTGPPAFVRTYSAPLPDGSHRQPRLASKLFRSSSQYPEGTRVEVAVPFAPGTERSERPAPS